MSIENQITYKIIGAAIEVHRQIGPGLLESAYENCLSYELSLQNIHFETQVEVPIIYKNYKVNGAYRVDFLVENKIIVELKAVETLIPLHEAQLLTYLKITKKPVGLLLNFNTEVMKDGIKRIIL